MFRHAVRSDRPRKTLSRRHFLVAGSVGYGGLSLVNLLRTEAAAGVRSSQKAIINVHLDGGPSQLDTIDLKPTAPVEIRGDFHSIATTVPGLEVCELLPKIASIADKFAFIRTLVGSVGKHDAFQCQSGFSDKELASIGGRPAMGSVLAKLKGLPSDSAPPFVDLMQGRPLVRNSARPGFLGPAYQAFRPDISHLFQRTLQDNMVKELSALGDGHSVSLALHPDLQVVRLRERLHLRSDLDRFRREMDDGRMMDAMDSFTQQAMGILTSGRLADALDLQKEDPRVLAHYTPRTDSSFNRSKTSDGPEAVRKFLLARRLIEAGVRCVSISISDFDTHSDNFSTLRYILPVVDQGLFALVTDLEERGRLNDVSIVVWGEFGRTPRIDPKTGGRHHWPEVGPALLAGGGMRTGQVLGVTDRTASTPVARPIRYQDVVGTLYHNLGIDARQTTIVDTQGRPQYLLDQGEPIRELV